MRDNPSPPKAGGCTPKPEYPESACVLGRLDDSRIVDSTEPMSMSWVARGAPSMRAAPIPMMRNRTPRSDRARNSRRSAGVSAKSSTAQTLAQPFGGRQLQTSERVVHVSSIDA